MSLYEVLKASKAQRFPDYWTLLWGRKLSDKLIKTLTGVLPLTFTAKAGNAGDWEIYGNDNNGTEQLFDRTQSAQGLVTAEGSIQPGTVYYSSDYIKITSNQDYCVKVNSIWDAGARIIPAAFYDDSKQFISYTQSEPFRDGTKSFVATSPSNAAYLRFSYVNYQDKSDEDVMLVRGSTAPDHFIPYQQGVGERTSQLLNCSTISGGVLNEYGVVIGADATTNIHADSGSISFTTGSVWRGIVTDFTEIKSDVENVTLTYSGDRAANWRFCFYDNSQTFISQSPDIDRQTRVVAIPNNTKYFRASAQYETAETYSLTSLSIVKGSTAPAEYVPYGYELPISVNNTPQTFYIGDSPLTAGQSISKTSTGVDLELSEGENTVSTALYNKPTMTITYK